MSKLTIKEIMKHKVITVSPDMSIEKAVAVAQKHRVGCLPVVEGGRVVGIMTTSDVFYKIVNPLLGIGQGGKRIIIYGAGKEEEAHRVMDYIIKEIGIKIKTFWVPPDPDKKDLVLHLDAADVNAVIAAIGKLGFKAEEREFKI